MRKFGTFEKALYRCAGASIEGLAQCPESEHRKYGFIGAIIVLTSMFAMLSGGYAMYYIFHSQAYATLFAVLWGLFILNLDRFIVSSMRKTDTFWREFGQALPRLVLAFIIAIVIARPLEIVIFSDEISSFLVNQKGDQKVGVLKEFDSYIGKIKQGFEARIADQVARLDQYRAERATTCEARDKAAARYLCEQDGTCGTSEKGYGPAAYAKHKLYSQLDKECSAVTARTTDLQNRINTLRDAFDRGLAGSVAESLKDDKVMSLEEATEINRLKQERDKRLSEIEQGFSTSFSSMNSALWAMQKTDTSVMVISFFLSLLFVVVEISPITVKLLARKGPYDYYLDFERDNAEAQYLRGRDMLHREKGTEFQREMEEMERQKYAETFKAFHDAKAPLEKEMLGKMLEQWKKKNKISGDKLNNIGSGLSRMIDDYAKLNAPRAEDGGVPLPTFRYPSQVEEPVKEQPKVEAPVTDSGSSMTSVMNRFLIVPMTIMVTVGSFLMALKFQTPISPYLVSFLSGLLYVTLSIVYFSVKGRSEEEK